MTQLPDFNDILTKISQWCDRTHVPGEGTAKDYYILLVEKFADILQSKNIATTRRAIGSSMIVLSVIAKMKGLTISKQTPSFAKGWPALTSNSVIVLGKISKAITNDEHHLFSDLVDDYTALLMIWATNHLLDIEECMDAAYQQLDVDQ